MIDDWITLARIVRPQGRRGEVLADLLTDFPEHFTGNSALALHSSDASDNPVQIENYWMPTGRNAGRVVLKISGVDSISAAETLAGSEIRMGKAARVTLADGTHYVSDLVGCNLFDGGKLVGRIDNLQFPLDPAGLRLPDVPVLFVVRRPDGSEILIPFANAHVQRIDTTGKIVEMNLPEGLLDLNA